MKNNFWLWLMRLAYRKLSIPQLKFCVGVPGQRDPDAVCSMYAPRKRVQGDSDANCCTDGHYLCNECAFSKFNPKNKASDDFEYNEMHL